MMQVSLYGSPPWTFTINSLLGRFLCLSEGSANLSLHPRALHVIEKRVFSDDFGVTFSRLTAPPEKKAGYYTYYVRLISSLYEEHNLIYMYTFIHTLRSNLRVNPIWVINKIIAPPIRSPIRIKKDLAINSMLSKIILETCTAFLSISILTWMLYKFELVLASLCICRINIAVCVKLRNDQDPNIMLTNLRQYHFYV